VQSGVPCICTVACKARERTVAMLAERPVTMPTHLLSLAPRRSLLPLLLLLLLPRMLLLLGLLLPVPLRRLPRGLRPV
jgi:hypothetical protein